MVFVLVLLMESIFRFHEAHTLETFAHYSSASELIERTLIQVQEQHQLQTDSKLLQSDIMKVEQFPTKKIPSVHEPLP